MAYHTFRWCWKSIPVDHRRSTAAAEAIWAGLANASRLKVNEDREREREKEWVNEQFDWPQHNQQSFRKESFSYKMEN